MLEDKVRSLIEKEVNNVGVSNSDIIYEKENNNYFLRIIIDSDEGIDIDKCVLVTNIINPLLDEANLIEESYILDISSKERGE